MCLRVRMQQCSNRRSQQHPDLWQPVALQNRMHKRTPGRISSRFFFPVSKLERKRLICRYWTNSDCWKGTQPAIHGPSLVADKTENKSFWDSSHHRLFISRQWPERHGTSGRLIARTLLKGHAIRFCSCFNKDLTDWLTDWTEAVLGKTWWSQAFRSFRWLCIQINCQISREINNHKIRQEMMADISLTCPKKYMKWIVSASVIKRSRQLLLLEKHLISVG